MKEKTFDEFQKSQIKKGMIILLIAMIFEIATCVFKINSSEAWFVWAYKQGVFTFVGEGKLIMYLLMALSLLLPIIALVFSILSFKGFEWGRNILVVCYGLFCFRLGLYTPYAFEILGSSRASEKAIIFCILCLIAFVYYVTMCILLSNKSVTEYMYSKRYK